jgi:hypothetical protein
VRHFVSQGSECTFVRAADRCFFTSLSRAHHVLTFEDDSILTDRKQSPLGNPVVRREETLWGKRSCRVRARDSR